MANVDKRKVKKFAKELGCSEYFSEFLITRGLDTKDKYDTFINAKISMLRDIHTMKDADIFLQKLNKAIDDKKEITVYGDYDCDGIMATCIVMFSLMEIGRNKVNWFVNNRFTEGYGMNKKGVEHLLQMYPNTEFIVTVDNGIRANEGIQYALDKGIDVIVSDHHKQPEDAPLPNCPVVCESRADESEELKESFCGAELARRLMSQLFIDRGIAKQKRTFLNGLCAYSGFATITDSVPMNAANHCIAKIALSLIKANYALVWGLLNERMTPKAFNQDLIGFTYGPMFNAPGRVIGTVDLCMDIMISAYNGDVEKAKERIEDLVEINIQRKDWAKEDDLIAFEQAAQFKDDNFIVLYSDDFREGINGLTSSHITEYYRVPSIVLSPIHGSDGLYKGSGRSVDAINLFELLEQCSDLMVGFGGHPMAAGLTVRKEDIPKLRAKLAAITPENPNKDRTPNDFTVNPADVTIDLIEEFDKLVPFGEGFEKPSFLVDGVITWSKTMCDKRTGVDRHMKYRFCTKPNVQPKTEMDILWWNCLDDEGKLRNMTINVGDNVSFIGTPEINDNGTWGKSIQMVVDIALV